MAKFATKLINNKKTWEDFIIRSKPQSFLQSWNWGETNTLIGKKIFRIGIYKDNKLVSAALVISERAKRGPYLVIPGGPMINWNDKPLVSFFIKQIKDLAIKEGAWFIRIRPEVYDSENEKKRFSKMRFISSPMHLHAENTWVLDISKEDETLLSEMRKTTRYLIRKSANLGLAVTKSKEQKDTKILANLQKETAQRHKFVGFSEKIFKSQLLTFGKDGQADLFICRKDNKNLAAAIIIKYGDTGYYHYSGSTDGFREIPFSYYLQWQIIKDLKSRGVKYYNFWGIAPNDNPNHRFAGVTLFKTGFGGRRVDWLHAQDLLVSWKYWLTYLFENIRRISRRL